MIEVKALTHFLGNEGMWLQGETREVSEVRAKELVKTKLVEAVEATDSTEPEKQEPKASKTAKK
jgi:hypothetical protein